MLTNQDIIRLKDTFLEKGDFLKAVDFYMTKEEHEYDLSDLIAHMATKEDLVDLENRLTNQFRNELTTQIAPIISGNQSRDEKQKELDEKFNRIMNSVDKLLIPLSVLKEEAIMSAVQYKRQVDWNHKVAEKVNVPFDY